MENYKINKCKYCGADIICYPRTDKKGFKERYVCDSCANPKFKTIICANCSKEFKVERSLIYDCGQVNYVWMKIDI